jgi:hypothetical protein
MRGTEVSGDLGLVAQFSVEAARAKLSDRGVGDPTATAQRPRRPAREKPLRERDATDPLRQVVELAQRGRMIVDVATADVDAAEAVHGAFHATTWHFRTVRDEARRAWDRLRAQLGTATLESALKQPPITVLNLANGGQGRSPVVLVPIAGQTYRIERVAGTPVAPVQWRLTRLIPPLEDGPYYACRLQDQSTQCDCADWTYHVAGLDEHGQCKHLAALISLGWL